MGQKGTNQNILLFFSFLIYRSDNFYTGLLFNMSLLYKNTLLFTFKKIGLYILPTDPLY